MGTELERWACAALFGASGLTKELTMGPWRTRSKLEGIACRGDPKTSERCCPCTEFASFGGGRTSGIGGVTCSLAGSTLEESVSAALLGFLTRAAGLIDGVSELTGKRGEPKTEDRSCCAGLVAAPVQNPAPSCTGRCGGADELREGASDGGGLGNPGMLEVSCAAVLPGNSRGRAPLRVD